MDLYTLSLMLFAGLLHASWHGLVKSGTDQILNLAGMGAVAALFAASVLPFVSTPPPVVWPVLAVSICLPSGYRIFLARAYSRDDLGKRFRWVADSGKFQVSTNSPAWHSFQVEFCF